MGRGIPEWRRRRRFGVWDVGSVALVALGAAMLVHAVMLVTTSNTEAQEQLAAAFSAADDPTIAGATPYDAHDDTRQNDRPAEPSDPSAPAAMLWFERGSAPIVVDTPLLVVNGVTPEHLAAGPGQYPHADPPGGPGNHALAGHRTTYGAPFGDLDLLDPVDTNHIVDRAGETWVYVVVADAIVAPDETWVVGDDPRGTGAPTVTLTTCHPRGSATQRLVVWGELVS